VPLLQVRDFPPDLYETLRLVAEQERRSIAQQTIVTLRSALCSDEANKVQRRQTFAAMRQLAASTPGITLDPVTLIRQGRQR
jgi:hypothetical protein